MADQKDLELLVALGNGIPITERPYHALGKTVGLSEEEVIERLAALMERGEIRRFGASLHHRKAGFTANAMVIWRVDPEETDAAAEIMTRFDEITHLYERPPMPEWPYTLYSMIHGRSHSECEEILHKIREATGLHDFAILYSVKEYKKTGVTL
jgi:DNA-binding Lrp family transcriptional regulator